MAAACATAYWMDAAAPDAGSADVLEDGLDVERVAAEFEVLLGALGCFGVRVRVEVDEGDALVGAARARAVHGHFDGELAVALELAVDEVFELFFGHFRVEVFEAYGCVLAGESEMRTF